MNQNDLRNQIAEIYKDSVNTYQENTKNMVLSRFSDSLERSIKNAEDQVKKHQPDLSKIGMGNIAETLMEKLNSALEESAELTLDQGISREEAQLNYNNQAKKYLSTLKEFEISGSDGFYDCGVILKAESDSDVAKTKEFLNKLRGQASVFVLGANESEKQYSHSRSNYIEVVLLTRTTKLQELADAYKQYLGQDNYADISAYFTPPSLQGVNEEDLKNFYNKELLAKDFSHAEKIAFASLGYMTHSISKNANDNYPSGAKFEVEYTISQCLSGITGLAKGEMKITGMDAYLSMSIYTPEDMERHGIFPDVGSESKRSNVLDDLKIHESTKASLKKRPKP